MRKATLILFIALSIFVTQVTQSIAANLPNITSNTVIWYLPHPDDETLAMAGAIARSVKAQNNNIFVFLTRGGGTLVRVFGRADDGRNLQIDDVKSARMREAKEALLILGAKPENIVFLDYPDGSLTMSQALAVVREYVDQYPGAMHRTVSVYDPHPDHKVLARALSKVVEERAHPLDVAYYRVYIYNASPSKRLIQPVLAIRMSEEEKKLKQRAISAYRTYDPTLGRYAIGARSVPELLSSAAMDPYEYQDVLPLMDRSISAHIQFEDAHTLCIGTDILFAESYWRLGFKGEAKIQPLFTIQLDYKLQNLPMFSRLYLGGALKLGANRSNPFIVLGVSTMNTLFAEYRQSLRSLSGAHFHWGVRTSLW